MKEFEFNTLGGLKAPILVYETLEEAEKVKPGGILDKANRFMVFHEVGDVARELIANLVEAKFGVARKSEVIGKTKTGKDKIQWETANKFVERVMAEKNLDNLDSLQDEVNSACRNFQEETPEGGTPKPPYPLAVDLTQSARTPKAPPRLAAKFKLAAAMALTIPGKLDTLNATGFLSATKLNKPFTPSVPVEGEVVKMFETTIQDDTGLFGAVDAQVKLSVSDKDAEALGWLYKEWNDRNTTAVALLNG